MSASLENPSKSASPIPDLVRVSCAFCGSADSAFERNVAGYALERCRKCGLVFVNPQPTNEGIAKLYTHKKDTAWLIQLYARIACPSILAQYEEKLDRLERTLPGRGRILDFACAAGYFFEQAAKRGWDAHGSDLGEWTFAAAEARGLKNLHVGTLRDLNFPDGHFDVVHAAQVFEHLPNPKEDLAELTRILRPGGLLYIDVPNYRTLPIMLGKDDYVLNTPPQHVNYFTPRTLSALVRSAGYESIEITSSGGLKWENLLGRSISSDIVDAYKPANETPAPASPTRVSPLTRVKRIMKRGVHATIVKPILYNRLKFGMTLEALARRPDHSQNART
jgi:2-polyprenyl-3-methyl-5-hydroxy-6-metoxy-1,4-benzoquinol methylase